MNHAPFALHFEPTANQTQEPDRDKNTLMLLAELGQNMWLLPACPPKSVPGDLLESEGGLQS